MQLSKQKHSLSAKVKTFKGLALIAGLALVLSNPLTIYAESMTFSVDGNGSGSENEIKVTTSQNQSVNQNNSSNQDNEIEVKSNTGGNNVSDNTGEEVHVETGEVESEISVITKDTNVNKVVQEKCCHEGSLVTVSNNGSDSQNSVNIQNSSTTSVNQNNTANINNQVKVTANTGNNTVKNNTGGDTHVTTGNIYSNISIANKNINTNTQKIKGGSSASPVVVTIKNNGSGSNNKVRFEVNNDYYFTSNNLAYINNKVVHDANTGNNLIDGNTGGVVWLKTGTVGIITSILNENINTNKLIVDLCCQVDDDDDGKDDDDNGGKDDDDDNGGKDDDNGKDENGKDNGGNKDNGNGGDDDEDDEDSAGGIGGPRGQVLGAILPATGANTITWLLANLALVSTGIGLKLMQGWKKLQGNWQVKLTIYY